jgi:hypothetical protein
MSKVPQWPRHAEEHTSHCSFFTGGSVGKTSGEVRARVKDDALSDQKRLSYGPI